jgi:ABC-type branched-subunit amino acid transport system ATPase component
MLRLEHICVAYGKHEALHDVTLEIQSGRTTVILGANGAGKTTLLNTIAGLMRPHPGGRILFEGRAIENDSPHRIVAAGIALVPEGRRLFGDMTVIENLRMGAYTPHARANEGRQLEKQLALFPLLAQRRNQLAKTMSGGEQQMLAIARALMSEPKILLLDEPSLGLGPRLVKDLFATLRIITQRGQSIVLVEQNVHQSLRLAHRVYVLENGHIVRSGLASEIQRDAAIQQAYLGLSDKRPVAVPVEPVRDYPGGFVNPFSRTVSPARSSIADDQEQAMAGQVASMPGSGFFHPYARSVPAQSATQVPAQPAADSAHLPAAGRTESIPTSGGFVNPNARPAKQ